MNVSVFSSRKELRFSAYSSMVVTRITFEPFSRWNQSPVARQSSSTAVATVTLRRKSETRRFLAARSLAEMFTPVWSARRRSSCSRGTSVASTYRTNSADWFVGAAMLWNDPGRKSGADPCDVSICTPSTPTERTFIVTLTPSTLSANCVPLRTGVTPKADVPIRATPSLEAPTTSA